MMDKYFIAKKLDEDLIKQINNEFLEYLEEEGVSKNEIEKKEKEINKELLKYDIYKIETEDGEIDKETVKHYLDIGENKFLYGVDVTYLGCFEEGWLENGDEIETNIGKIKIDFVIE